MGDAMTALLVVVRCAALAYFVACPWMRSDHHGSADVLAASYLALRLGVMIGSRWPGGAP